MDTNINLFPCNRVPIGFCLEGLCDLCVTCALREESAPMQVVIGQTPELAQQSDSAPLLLSAD